MTKKEFLGIKDTNKLLNFADDVGFDWWDNCHWEMLSDGLDDYIKDVRDTWFDDEEELEDLIDDLNKLNGDMRYNIYCVDECGIVSGLGDNDARFIREPLLKWCIKNHVFDKGV